MKCNVIIGIMMIAALNMVGTYFQGLVVVRLPFEPFGIIQGITQLQSQQYHTFSLQNTNKHENLEAINKKGKFHCLGNDFLSFIYYIFFQWIQFYAYNYY